VTLPALFPLMTESCDQDVVSVYLILHDKPGPAEADKPLPAGFWPSANYMT
jgi:hypothetical protein